MHISRKLFGTVHRPKILKKLFPEVDEENILTIMKLYTENVALPSSKETEIIDVLRTIRPIINGICISELTSKFPVTERTSLYIDFKDVNKITFIYDFEDQRFKIMSIDALKQARRNKLRSAHTL